MKLKKKPLPKKVELGEANAQNMNQIDEEDILGSEMDNFTG